MSLRLRERDVEELKDLCGIKVRMFFDRFVCCDFVKEMKNGSLNID